MYISAFSELLVATSAALILNPIPIDWPTLRVVIQAPLMYAAGSGGVVYETPQFLVTLNGTNSKPPYLQWLRSMHFAYSDSSQGEAVHGQVVA